MRVLVCGGRAYSKKEILWETLDKVLEKYPDLEVVHGAARGADILAEMWCKEKQVPYIGVPARWTDLGKAAGMIRNKKMLDDYKPDQVVAFPGGSGTANMCNLAEKSGVGVWRIKC